MNAINWVSLQPDRRDPARISLFGFRAGAYIALVTSSTVFHGHTFPLVVAFYPPLDMESDPATKIPPDTVHGKPLPAFLVRLFSDNYAPTSSVDCRDSKISSLFMDAQLFPESIIFITAACDSLCNDAEELAKRLAAAGKHAKYERMLECEHAWEKSPCKEGSMQEQEKRRAYATVVNALKQSLDVRESRL